MANQRLLRYVPVVAGLLMSTGCIHRTATTDAAGNELPLAQRLVLALDGIDYRDVMAARERGLFAEFREPSRLISTFPSISDVAWHDILGVLPPRGYQRIYFSTAYNDVVGTTLDAIRPIEFEERMDMAFGTKFHHLSAYVASNSVARKEITTASHDFFRYRGRPTVYVYNVGPDALQHTRGDLEAYLGHLDSQLLALQREYRKRTGRSLEIVVLSDHGHNHHPDAKFLPLARDLKAHGFHATDQLKDANDVAFSVDGVTTGFGVFVTADSVPVLAGIIARMDGVELVTSRVTADRYLVQDHDARAVVERRRIGGIWHYRYLAEQGDPLEYRGLVARMTSDAAVDSDGFADGLTWLRYTANTKFPAALERIARGHTAITLNPAPILVSVENGSQVGLGLVSVANRLRPLGGTHGGLDSANALGVVMTNFKATHDDVTERVRDQFGGFADLSDIQHPASGARLMSKSMHDRDPRRPVYADTTLQSHAPNEPLLELWLTDEQRQWATEGGGIFVAVQRVDANGAYVESVAVNYLPIPTPKAGEGGNGNGDGQSAKPHWIVADDGRHFLLPVKAIVGAGLTPLTSYSLRVALDRTPSRKSDMRSLTREIATFSLRTTVDGHIWPY